MKTILHICPKTDWEAAQEAGVYTADSLESEGFIHCSEKGQIARVANSFYKDSEGLVLLHISIDNVEAKIRWEDVEGKAFPHIYGPINLDAVVGVETFTAGEDGIFVYP